MSETMVTPPAEPETEIHPDSAALAAEAVVPPETDALLPETAREPSRTERVIGRLSVAGKGLGQKFRESSRKTLKELEKGDEFYDALGERAVEGAFTSADDVDRTHARPQNRTQRRHVEKVAKKVQEHEHRAKTDQWREDYYAGTTYMSELDKKASKRAFKQARATLREDLEAGRIDADTYTESMTTLSKDTMVAKPDKATRKLREGSRESAEKLEKVAYPRRVKAVRETRKRLNRAIAGRSADETVPVEPTYPEPTLVELDLATIETPAVPTPAESPLAKLRRMRAEGKFGPDPVEAAEPKAPEAKSATEKAVEPETPDNPEQLAALFGAVESGTASADQLAELMTKKGNIKVEYIYSGGTTIPGTDEWIPGEKTPTYFYETVGADGKTVRTRMDKRLAKQVLGFEPSEPVAATIEPEAETSPFSNELLGNARKVRKQVKDAVRKGLQVKKEEARGTLFDESAAKAELEGEELQRAIAGIFGVGVDEFKARVLSGDIDSKKVSDLTDALEYLDNEASKPKAAPMGLKARVKKAAEAPSAESVETDVKVVAKDIWDGIEAKAKELVDAAKEADPDNFDAKAAWSVARRQVKDEALGAVAPELRSGVRTAMRELDEEAYKERQAKREARASAPKPAPTRRGARREQEESAAAKAVRENAQRTALDL